MKAGFKLNVQLLPTEEAKSPEITTNNKMSWQSLLDERKSLQLKKKLCTDENLKTFQSENFANVKLNKQDLKQH